ncbi:MAG: septal ring lytic transglycosylase RlpA family protein [Sediminibacterium sp.]|jgi:rare lipoprotein A
MRLFKNLKAILVAVIILLYFKIGLSAQNIYPNTLTNANFLDSANIKRYKKWIDTSRIHIELNRVIGIASFYSKSLNGTLTSNGERFNNKNLTAACNLFKLNTIVRVTNLRNGSYVLVRVNDRMHPTMLKKGRIIDLSQAAAKKLIINSNGLAKVSIEAIGYSKITPKS